MKKYLFFLLLILFCTGCKKTEEIASAPIIRVLTAISLSSTRTDFSGEIITSSPGLVDSYGVAWGADAQPTTGGPHQAVTAKLSVKSGIGFTVTGDGFQAGKAYYARAYVEMNGQTYYSEAIQFTQQSVQVWQQLQNLPEAGSEPIPDDAGNEVDLSGSFLLINRRTAGTITTETWRYGTTYLGWDKLDAPALAIYSPIRMVFRASDGLVQGIVSGAGYYINNQSPPYRTYRKYLQNDNNSAVTPYPGSDAPTTTFTLGQTGYIIEQTPQGVTWQFDLTTQTWKNGKPFLQPGGFPIAYMANQTAFILVESLGEGMSTGQLYRYEPITDSWTKRTAFPGENRRNGVHFTQNNKFYYGAGESLTTNRGLRDIWQYDPATDRWTHVVDYPGAGQANLNAIRSGSRVYIGFGYAVTPTVSGVARYDKALDFWFFTP